ncbi:putative DNA binding domain-containing protein [Synechococcus sp. HJ21-Hayes]|uniref:ATP-binding protein n=1 Tax=unclassified Synechococcus TaxID=2626047 RepID=UPI0020CECFAC|nr:MULTISPECIES: ATP-binding protein [unclassified Synechococcus]MCP9832144.1 putative DNA binding domain-containing protein [Synechococcus sp. JJ3a-Johnson]MCP9853700.1 putative DNA binding domain-containing protein [Synechococcus sp. HJ21-Hayes]
MTAPGLGFDVTPFLHQDEGQHFDRKSLFHGPPEAKKPRDRKEVRDQVARYVAGFANAEGGVLILGIEDNHTITGHQLPQSALQTLLSVPQSRCEPPLPPGLVVPHDGHELVVFDVPSTDGPVQVTGDGFPLRMGDQTVDSSESKIQALKLQGLVESHESRPSALKLSDLDSDLLAQARRGAGLESLSDSDYLLKRKLADRRGSELVLRQAAELLFARLGPDHPNAGVRVFRVVGTERRLGATHNVEERPRIEGNLPQVWQEAVGVIGGLMRQPSRLVGNRFQAVSEYPRFSWQEALLNAIAHRDYSIQGNCIEVWLFDDRMEVVSPGGLLPELDLQELLSRKRVHCSRNPRLMRTLVDLGLTRDQGEGIPRMFAEMEDAFLPAPRIEPTARNVSVVLGNTTTLTEADRTFVERLAAEDLTQEEFRALLQAHRNTQVDNASLRQLMGLDTLAASQVLRRLRDRSMLELHRAGAQSFYTLDPGLLAGDRPGQGNLVLDRGELAADRGELPADRGELGADRGESGPISSTVTVGDFLGLDPALQQALASLGTRPRKEKLRQVIGQLCSDQWRTGAWLAGLLNRQPENLSDRHLSPMVKDGLLERRFPDIPNHPEQAYRSPSPSNP